MTIALAAPAKINWTLEVLAKRPDGYHDIATVFQTVSLGDGVVLTGSPELTLELTGESGELRAEAFERNLALRAARALQLATGVRRGAAISLEKRVPAGAGLGGGSSDAAAVLRGLNRLWALDLPPERLAEIGAELGSDVPFFIAGGTAFGEGRGEILTPLPDAQPTRLILAWPTQNVEKKTARMYGALRPGDLADGAASRHLRERIESRLSVRDEDIHNVFDRALPRVMPDAARSMVRVKVEGIGVPHLCGSGGAFFLLAAPDEDLSPKLRQLRELDLNAVEARTLTAAEAVAFEEA